MPVTTPITALISGRCDRLGDRLPALLDDPDALNGTDRRHLEQCLRCQADLARYRRLRRILGTMRSDSLVADSLVADSVMADSVVADTALAGPGGCEEALGEVLDGLDSAAERRDRHRIVGRRAVSIVGLAAATAAGVGGVLVLATRRRSA